MSTELKNKDLTSNDAKPVLSAGTGNLLELFAGSRSIGKVGDELGMNVFPLIGKTLTELTYLLILAK